MKKGLSMSKLSLLLFMFLAVSTTLEAQSERTLKTVFGTITFENKPLSNVNIQVKFTQRGTKTNEDGSYAIEASEGEVLEFSYVGFEPVSIVIEDVTTQLDIRMRIQENKLDEAVVMAVKKSSSTLQPELRELDLSIGTYRLEELGSVQYLDKARVSMNTLSLASLLRPYLFGKEGRIIYELDGIPFIYPPIMALGVIEEIYIVSDASMARYGYYGKGNIIIIRTIDSIRKEQMAANQLTDLKSNIFYANNAVDYRDNWSQHASFFNALNSIRNAEEAYVNYTAQNGKPFHFHLEAANFFYKNYPEEAYAKRILLDLKDQHTGHPEILKAIAYYLERQGELNESLAIYTSLLQLRPNYAQSYRDLANAYREDEQFTRAWRTYMYGMLKAKLSLNSGVGDLVYNEMEWLFFRKSKETDIKETFQPRQSMLTPFENDIRMVFEWNTSEAEFELEFVNPSSRSYSFVHTMEANDALITEEKLQGYSSKEFLQEQLLDGEWTVYITYFGNKKQSPTYLKMTTYFNWGKENERKEIEIFQLQKTNVKMQISAMNQQQLANQH